MPFSSKRLFLCLLALGLGCAGTGNARCQQLTFSTLAGNAGYGSSDGAGANAQFNYPQGVAVDNSGNVYVADSRNNTIREITPAGVVSTIAGSPGLRGNADGNGGSALFSSPGGVAADGSGNLYVADTLNHTIRKVTTAGSTWLVTTVAGEAGVAGTNDGVGTNALFRSPGAVAVDQSGRLYVADTYNDTVRLVTPAGTNWMVTTLAGTAGLAGAANGTNTAATFSLPSGIAVDASNNLFVADTGNSEIREIVPVGTNWVVSTLVNNELVGGIAIDGSSNLVAAASAADIILKVTYAGQVTTVAGTSGVYGSADGTNGAASFNYPQGVAVGTNGFIYVADSLNNTIRKITPSGVVSTLAGLAGGPGSADGSNSLARFAAPQGVAVDGQGGVYLADSANNTIRKAGLAGTNWVVSTLAGLAGSPGSADGTNGGAQFDSPVAVAVGGIGKLFVADFFNNEIREITNGGTNWVVSTFAGRPGTFYSGSVTNTLVTTNVAGGMTNLLGYTNVTFVLTNYSVFTNFSGLLTNISGGNTDLTFVVTNVPLLTNVVSGLTNIVYLSTNFFTLANVVTNLDGPAAFAIFSEPSSIGFDPSGNLYVADRGNNSIRQISTSGQVITFAGSALANGAADGQGTNALFFHPSGLAVDTNGNIFVADTDNSTIRKVTSAGQVTTIAGSAGLAGRADGTNNSARFGSPQAVTIDISGNLYVADAAFHTIRKITPSGTNWIVSTVGGVAGVHGSYDGIGTNALFFAPHGLAADGSGNLYIADTDNNTLRFGRAMSPVLQISLLANQVILSWPVSAGNFALETAASLSPPATWTPVSGATDTGTNFVFTTNAAVVGTNYFRLHLQ
jgi:sugar lactone lactonase YvrE